MHSAPAKIILFGEHAVVYGQPAIAVPFTAICATADAQRARRGSGLTIKAYDIGKVMRVTPHATGNPLVYAARLTLDKLNRRPPDLTLHIRSTIPLASGFGSGAAVTAALIRELSAAMDSPIEGDDLNDMVYEIEKLHHGTPSGIDNTVIVKGAPVYFVRGVPPQPFTIGRPLTLVIANSGIAASTRETVGAVRKLYDSDSATYQRVFDEIGGLVREARIALEQGDASRLGFLMDRNQEYLQSLTVSSEALDTLNQAARNAGALGAKLSGGGRGGNVIALADAADAERVAAAVREAGAVDTWITTVE